MKKTLFKKYLSAFMSVILISFLILGVVLYIFVSNYRTSEKRKLLTKNANNIASTISNNGLERNVNYTQDTQNESNSDNIGYTLKNESLLIGILNTVSGNIDSDIFVTDFTGKILLYSNVSPGIDTQKSIPNHIMDQLEDGQYVGINHLGELYSNNYYTVGVPIKADNSQNEQVIIGAVFIATDAGQMDNLAFEILKLFLFSAAISLLLAIFIAWTLSYNMVKPLREMSRASTDFGNGDFSKRVIVKTRDELGILAKSFNSMADSLEASEETRKNFVANVSHELKTPMTTISGFIDGICDGTITQKDQPHYLNIVSEEIKRLSRLVRSMLNLSKIDDKDVVLNKSRFDLLPMVVNILPNFEKQLKDKNVEVRGLQDTKGVFINADIDMIYQVIYNLIENSAKFVNKNGYIEINLRKTENNAVFSIKNSGDGLSKKDINLIFDRFYKTDKSRSNDKTGIGLGLYIVKKILYLHGGTITATSNKGKDCTFKFIIPIDNTNLKNMI